MKLEQMPRIRLAHLPTPLEEMKNLSKELGGPRLFIKRDDATGLAFGGNKARKLEFIMADAVAQGADVVITSGGVQTNHGRMTVAAATKLGLKPVLILTGEEPEVYQGNLALSYLMGAEIHFVAADPGLDYEEKMRQLRARGEEKALEVKKEYEKQGLKCYIVPRGGRMPQGTAGYLNGVLELYQQMIEMNLKVDYIVTATGSTSTTGSLILGNKVFNTGIKTIGISVSRSANECKDRIMEELEKDIAFYEYDVQIERDEIVVFDDYIGPGYSLPTEEGINAIKLLAQKEAIILDYTYSGKAMAGLIDLIKKGYFSRDDVVVFLHTGGGPGLFALDDKLYRK
ncbi:MAG: D-cysteine desulfhydrase family protein [Firmicutes bacterium]|nr:D-cysteine desulfhydrase family protein [Bacillota bacterium]